MSLARQYGGLLPQRISKRPNVLTGIFLHDPGDFAPRLYRAVTPEEQAGPIRHGAAAREEGGHRDVTGMGGPAQGIPSIHT